MECLRSGLHLPPDYPLPEICHVLVPTTWGLNSCLDLLISHPHPQLLTYLSKISRAQEEGGQAAVLLDHMAEFQKQMSFPEMLAKFLAFLFLVALAFLPKALAYTANGRAGVSN